MRSLLADGESRLSFWLRVREFAVPPPMIDAATRRRTAGDWAGACAAARVDVDLDLRSVARTHGSDLAVLIKADLRHLVPDLLRWHLPRICPDGLIRPGLTIALARYAGTGVHLVARTAPGWADAGQRISLALWDGTLAVPHPHPHPDRRFRLDLHRHLWDDRRTGELAGRSGLDSPVLPHDLPSDCAVHRWPAEAQLVLADAGQTAGAVAVRLGGRRRLLLEPGDPPRITPAAGRWAAALPVLPDAATWVLPDLALLRAGLIEPGRLHPLVAAALAPGRPPAGPRPAAELRAARIVDCRGARHRLDLVDGVLVALDHDPAEIRREGLLAELTGTPLPCLRAIDDVHRSPTELADVRARLDHGDTAGALATVERLLGPDALLRDGALHDELETAALRRVRHGLYRAGLSGLAGRGIGGQLSDRSHRRRRARR